MKCCLEQAVAWHGTRCCPRDRRAVACQGILFRGKSPETLTKTRIDPLLAGFVVALLTSTLLSCSGVAATTAPTTELISLSASGGPANSSSAQPVISADGRYVVFTSFARNLVAGDTNER